MNLSVSLRLQMFRVGLLADEAGGSPLLNGDRFRVGLLADQAGGSPLL